MAEVSDAEKMRRAFTAALEALGPSPAPAQQPAPDKSLPAVEDVHEPEVKPKQEEIERVLDAINAKHNKTHNLLKCPKCRPAFAKAIAKTGLEVDDRGDRIVIKNFEG